MLGLGTTELLIILVLVIVLFGVGRISKIGNELGKGISGFRQWLREGQDEFKEKDPDSDE